MRVPVEPPPLEKLLLGGVTERACRWIVGGDTGVSSRAIWAVMMGVHEHSHDRCTPSDPSDFGRCYRLLKLIPEWEDNLSMMKVLDHDRCINGINYPKVWSSFVDHYYTMKRLYLREHLTGSAPELYKFMKSLGL
jgi:hypothetical protein